MAGSRHGSAAAPENCAPGRIIHLLLAVALLGSFGLGLQPSNVAAHKVLASFSIDEAVSRQDADLVIEGIHLAQDFFIEQIGVTIDREVHVSVLSRADLFDREVVAASMGRSIIVYAGSSGWALSSPSEKLRSIVHEYVHYYQYLKTGLAAAESPAWFEEGVAEYLSLLLLDDLQIVDRADIESHLVAQLSLIPPDRALQELESYTAFGETGAAGYPLAYFGVARAFEGSNLKTVVIYYGMLADGLPFEDAFEQTFGKATETHYRQFGQWLERLGEAREIPSDVAIYEGIAMDGAVRLTEAPDQATFDEQILIRARTLDAAICSLMLISMDTAVEPIQRSSFADGNGDVFFLVTVPTEALAGPAELVIDCGSEPARLPVMIG